MINYIAMISVCTIGIVFFDDDPSSVSAQEWFFYAVMIYAAIGCLRKFAEIADRENDDY